MYPVFTIQVPDPFFEGQTAIYVIRSSPLTLIDTGISTLEAYETLQAGLTAHQLSLTDVGRVILTHKHIDHIGNAWRIQQATGAEVLIHEDELSALTNVDAHGDRFKALAHQCLQEWNVPGELRSAMLSVPSWQMEPVRATGLVDGQEVSIGNDSLTVIHTPGHTRGSICLKYGNLLFSGDHVLPNISPNIGAGDLRQAGLLRMFFASLEKIQRVGTHLQIMPGHGAPFANLADRCRALIGHHLERLDQIVSILQSNEMTVYEIARQLFGELEGFHVLLGCAEANAHLEFLVEERRVVAAGTRFRVSRPGPTSPHPASDEPPSVS